MAADRFLELNRLVPLRLLRRVGARGPNILTVVVMRVVRPEDEAGTVKAVVLLIFEVVIRP